MADSSNKAIVSKQGFIRRDKKGRFVSGASGNPGGRPVNTLAKTARDILSEVQKDGKTKQEAFVRKMIDDAIDGDATARKLIWAYIDGLPTRREETPEDKKVTSIKVQIVSSNR